MHSIIASTAYVLKADETKPRYATRQTHAHTCQLHCLGAQAIARLWRVAHFMLSDFLNLAIEDVSAGEVSLQAALCPAASPHVFVTAPPVAERPWQGGNAPTSARCPPGMSFVSISASTAGLPVGQCRNAACGFKGVQ